MLQAQIFIDKDEIYRDGLLYHFVMEFLIQHEISGATAINGFMGFGRNQKMKNPNLLFSFDEQPMLITFADQEEKVLKVIKALREITPNGLILTHKVDIHI